MLCEDRRLLQVLDVDPHLRAVAHLQLGRVTRRRQQVAECLHVDLQVRYAAGVCAHAFPASAQLVEDLRDDPRQEARQVGGAEHAEGLAAARLAV
eukprot:CAMPEP_0175472770 /NCGR_PEP_ID=MMETSP0095-20121207/74037_1 /TAXON_ID=311494 /ORGANISM="Alexandrium monilatum, Strain CCMP3105" /LENGTH=94 /DNA_ID=CAMNT_0016774245 /DNA_START=135 /DNA_END=415 /DNA_ORIENTATION=-